MDRKRVREQIVAAAKPSLAKGEAIFCCGPVRATDRRRRVPLPFRRRSRHYIAVTNRRLILFRATRRRQLLTLQSLILAKRLTGFTLEKERRSSRRLQLRIRGIDERRLALKFRPRDRYVGQGLATALDRTAATSELRRVDQRGAFAGEVGSVAEKFVHAVPEVAPWTARPEFDGGVRSLGWVEAQLVLLRGWVDEHGIVGADGQPQAVFTHIQQLEAQALMLRSELGLTPQALATLLGSLARVAGVGADDGAVAALKAESRRIVGDLQVALRPVDAEVHREADHGRPPRDGSSLN